MKNTNWKALQAYKGEVPAAGVLPRYMHGGYWRADLSKHGARYVKSSGAGSKR